MILLADQGERLSSGYQGNSHLTDQTIIMRHLDQKKIFYVYIKKYMIIWKFQTNDVSLQPKNKRY